jgi:hypothetical protein
LHRQRIDGELNEANQMAADEAHGEAFGLATKLASCVAGMLATWRVRQRCIRRNEAARLLAITLRTVDKLAASGILKKLKLPGRTRSCGFLESDVLALIIQSKR